MGFGAGSGVSAVALWNLGERLARLEQMLAAGESESALRGRATEKIRQRGTLNRGEVAAYLGVSTKKVQRMEAKGQLRRCSNLDGVVRYLASDVLRLASAK